MKTYILYVKNEQGKYEPSAMGCFKALLPLSFGHTAMFVCLG